MRTYLFINLFFFVLYGYGQNLIPNAGFEEKNIETRLQWRQPQGEYYHYQEGSEESGLSHTGNYFNGICMYNYQENEYLSIRLKEKLKKGQRYCASFYLRLYDGKKENYELTDKIGWYFSEQNIQANNLINLEVLPQAVFKINDTLIRTNWQFVQTSFEAKGTENFVTIGYFNSLGVSEKYKRQQRDNFLGVITTDSVKSEVIQAKQRSNKKKKLKEKDLEKFRTELNKQSAKKPPEQISTRDIFSVRYYFDDFCLTPIAQSCTCEIEKLDLKMGENFVLENILFETNSAILLPIAEENLNLLATYLLKYKNVKIKVKGHTDKEGSQNDNQKLSLQRAESVKEFFVTRGIDSERIYTEGFGFLQPLDSNNTEEGKSKNRRVEFELIAE